MEIMERMHNYYNRDFVERDKVKMANIEFPAHPSLSK